METHRETAREPSYVVVDFLNLDPTKFSFGTTKKNAHEGIVVPIKYEGKSLYVRYPKRSTPFGVSPNVQKADPKKGTPEKVTSYTMALNCHKEYEKDPLYLKARELDEMFIDECTRNSCAWGIGGSVAKPLARERVAGDNDYGDEGKWKRLIKWSYKKDPATNEKIYSAEYPPRLEVAVPATIVGDDIKIQSAKFTANFFDVAGEKINSVTNENISETVPKFSDVSVLAGWSHMTQGIYGITMKPSAKQMVAYPRNDLPSDTCLLNDNAGGEVEDSEDFGGVSMMDADTAPAVRGVASRLPTQPRQVPPAAAPTSTPTSKVQVSYVDEEDEGGEDAGEVVPSSAPAPPVTRTATRVVARTVPRKP